ncbi:MAG TPA: N-acetylmuramoyl-L-alanine amidase [Gemmatimonadales bacterium]|nr:N-acetylmuramoyl-L-alanine amidase [Gemmatimonadales bacterium]
MAVHVDRSLRLPDDEYFAEPQAKNGIALHHTVCDKARTTLMLWRRDRTAGGKPKRVATAFVIDRDGTIFQAFDPACWAFQFGLSWARSDRIPFERRFIGIEIASEGGLLEHDGRLYAYDRVAPHFEKSPDEALDCGTPYRGFRWFDRYEPAQLTALGGLVDELCARFSIPRVYPAQPFLYYGDALRSFNGVIGHAMVRSDKSDPAPDPDLWRTLERLAGLVPTPISPSPLATAIATPLTDVEVEALFTRNMRRLDRMSVAAGSLVKTLLMELERRDVYLKLATPAPGGRSVGYDVVQGDRDEVIHLGRALGFMRVTEQELEVWRA